MRGSGISANEMGRFLPKRSFMYERPHLAYSECPIRFSFPAYPVQKYTSDALDAILPVLNLFTVTLPCSVGLNLIWVWCFLSRCHGGLSVELKSQPTNLIYFVILSPGCKSTCSTALKFWSSNSSTGPRGRSPFTNENSFQSQEGGRSFSSTFLFYDTRKHTSFGS